MAEVLDHSALVHWQNAPTDFICEVMNDPETGKPFDLFPAQKRFFKYAWQRDHNGRLLYREQIYGAPKKTGKTELAAIHLLTTTMLYGGPFAEGYCIANDYEQAQGRVFEAVRKIIECSPYLKREANITANKITFPATGATITALASDYAGAAGSNPTISSFDELWGYTSESARRLWDESVPVPTRKVSCRLVTSYAGFQDESTLLEELHQRGTSQPLVGKDLYAGGGMLCFWTHDLIAPWQTEEWREEMRRSLRPNQFLRMIENRFISTDSTFVDMDWYDSCVDPEARPIPADKTLPIYVGVDASVKRDSTAIVCVAWDDKAKKVKLVWHRIFQPTKADPIDFEMMIEETIADLRKRFLVRRVSYDPYQMQASAQRLRKAGIFMSEFPQSVQNLTRSSQNLYELIKSNGITVYRDDDIRLAMQRSVAIESTRGWRIAKEKTSHKIDAVVALGMAAYGAVRQGQREMPTGIGLPRLYEGDQLITAVRGARPAYCSTSGSGSAETLQNVAPRPIYKPALGRYRG